MIGSLRSLLAGAFDYAGMFPLESLSLDQAIRNFADYRGWSEWWMLGRFVCPVQQLSELAPQSAELFDRPLSTSVICRRAETVDDFEASLVGDFAAIRECRYTNSDHIRVEMIELCLPADLPWSDTAALGRTLASMRDELDRAGLSRVPVFCELPSGDEWLARVEALAVAIRQLGDEQLGLKVRTGATESSEAPSPCQLAEFLEQCRANNVRCKATAGLHQPFARRDHDTGVWHFGFVNVLVAATLMSVTRLIQADVERILTDESVEHFEFASDLMAWRRIEATSAEIEYARRRLQSSFGSCSFVEPLEGLRELRLLT